MPSETGQARLHEAELISMQEKSVFDAPEFASTCPRDWQGGTDVSFKGAASVHTRCHRNVTLCGSARIKLLLTDGQRDAADRLDLQMHS